jgi:hypothetical protein
VFYVQDIKGMYNGEVISVLPPSLSPTLMKFSVEFNFASYESSITPSLHETQIKALAA